MNTVLSLKQAKEITGGRAPLTPTEYQEAVKFLRACTELDEAKYWHDKADVLAAWAKLYHDQQIEHWSRQLKLLAARRMGEVSMELRPHSAKRKGWKANGRNPGHVQLMMDQGLKRSQAVAASAIAKVPNSKFERILDRKVVPSPSSFIRRHSTDTTETWRLIREGARNPFCCAAFCQSNPPVRTAHALSKDEARVARKLVKDLMEWIDRFEQALPVDES
jgi:hypothetical protein